MLSMLIIGRYPAGFLMLAYLSETGLPQLAPMPCWLLPYLKSKSPTTPHLHAPGVTSQDNIMEESAELTS